LFSLAVGDLSSGFGFPIQIVIALIVTQSPAFPPGNSRIKDGQLKVTESRATTTYSE
jgi:hypothetical protein